MKNLFNLFTTKKSKEKANKIVYKSGMYFEVINNEWFPIEETNDVSPKYNRYIFYSYLSIDRLIKIQDLYFDNIYRRKEYEQTYLSTMKFNKEKYLDVLSKMGYKGEYLKNLI